MYNDYSNYHCWGLTPDYFEKFDPKSIYQNCATYSPSLAIYSYDVLNEAIEYINCGEPSQVLSFIGDLKYLKGRESAINVPNILINQSTVTNDERLTLGINYINNEYNIVDRIKFEEEKKIRGNNIKMSLNN